MVRIKTIPFNEQALTAAKGITQAIQYPSVYILSGKNEAYVGETINIAHRLQQHIRNADRRRLDQLRVIMDKQFNKSATTDIEASLIKYLSADGQFRLQNGNAGIRDYNYYQKDRYKEKFEEIWRLLIKQGIAQHNQIQIENSDLFKFSPYKSLTDDQYKTAESLFDSLLQHLRKSEEAVFLVHGGAGTGKTVLAVYLMKLMSDIMAEHNDMEEEIEEAEDEFSFQSLYYLKNVRSLKIGLVIPMTSLRKTLKKVFRQVQGLRSSMVIGPSDVIKSHYDVLIVDEAHRLRQKKNIMPGHHKVFDRINASLGLTDGNELDWIQRCSDYQILFYDDTQSIKPTDIDQSVFQNLVQKQNTEEYFLTSQMRVAAGQDYIAYIENILYEYGNPKKKEFKNYEFLLYDHIRDLKAVLKQKEKEVGLCRLVAGYAWKWKTQNHSLDQIRDQQLYDIEIEDERFIWNSVNEDWVNSANAINEVGCIHTVQGYDLNYAGVIIGPELGYDEQAQQIVVHSDQYLDRFGKAAIHDEEILKKYILNIYKVLLTRAIRGTYVYVCDPALRNYFKTWIASADAVRT